MTEKITSQQTTDQPPALSSANGPPTADDVIVSYHPVSGDKLGEVQLTPPEDAPAIMQTARQAQPAWASMTLKARIEVVRKIRNLLYERHEELVQLLCDELGKVPHGARFEIIQQLASMNYLTREAPRVLKSRREFVPLLPHRRHHITRKPHGVVLGIVPWNFPVVLALDVIAPALLAGNAVIYKPSEHTPLIAEFITSLIREAGVPPGVLQVVHGYAETGAALIDARPDKICFTGSVATGRKIAARAGELLIPVTLELGGKDAAVVLEDANIERTARGLVWAGMLHAGQMCISVERVYVVEAVADKLIGAMRKAIRQCVKPGLASDPRATYGPMTLRKQVEVIEQHIQEAEARGARIFREMGLDPTLENYQGLFCPPVLITDVPDDAQVVTEETFGPVIVVIPVKDEAEAIRRANDSRYGLSASVWTEDKKRGRRVALQLEAGMTSVNDHAVSIASPPSPWGGVKDSGYGRNGGKEGLLDMTIVQTYSDERFRLPIEPFWYPYTRLKRAAIKRLVKVWFAPSLLDRVKALWPF